MTCGTPLYLREERTIKPDILVGEGVRARSAFITRFSFRLALTLSGEVNENHFARQEKI